MTWISTKTQRFIASETFQKHFITIYRQLLQLSVYADAEFPHDLTVAKIPSKKFQDLDDFQI